MRFVHDTLPQRVCFGSGEAGTALQREIGNLGASRVMVIASRRDAAAVEAITARIPVTVRGYETRDRQLGASPGRKTGEDRGTLTVCDSSPNG